MRLHVLNPRGRDAFIDYRDGPGAYAAGVHPPVNFHAYAAATGGAFHRSIDPVLDGDPADPVLVLIRGRTALSLDATRRLRDAGRLVLVAWKEAGPRQVAGQLARPRARAAYASMLAVADGLLSPTRGLPPRPDDAATPVAFVPTPYPLEHEAWDYSIPIAERRGILVGTRQFKVASRNHAAAIECAARLAERVGTHFTVIASEGWSARRRLARMGRRLRGGDRLRVVERSLPYDAYLRLMAEHRLVLQRDRSGVPGQVAGDALLCRSICAGGDGAIDEIAYPDLAGVRAGAGAGAGGGDAAGADDDALARLLEDDAAYAAAVADAQARGTAEVSFRVVATRLAAWGRELAAARSV